ncbi:MAG: YceD family protein [Halothermotrichaceae bacterium]
MIIDLSNLKEVGSYKSIKKKVDIPDINYRKQEIKAPFPFDIKLDIYNTQDSFVLTGNLTGSLIMVCSRCLEKFNYDLDIKIDEELLKEDLADVDSIDLTDLFLENILINMPIKPLCDEDCKGLCPQCGQNLNKGECDCEVEFVDPRLAKLKELLDEDEEE